MFGNLFKPRPSKRTGQALYEQAAQAARHVDLYRALHVPDQLESRFEMFTLHVWALLERFRGQGEEASEVAQALFDSYVKALDVVLREQGIGDTALAKKMKALGQALFGRMKAFDDAVASEAPQTSLSALFGRILTESDAADMAAQYAPLADYALRLRESLRGQDLADLLQVRVIWPKPLL